VSYRRIFDLSDLSAARILIRQQLPASPARRTTATTSDWLTLDYHPLFIDWRDIEANAESGATAVAALATTRTDRLNAGRQPQSRLAIIDAYGDDRFRQGTLDPDCRPRVPSASLNTVAKYNWRI
jgi:hypothetical protein